MRGALAALAVVLAVWAAAGVMAARADPARDYAAARAALKPHFDEAGFLDDKPETAALAQHVWRAAEAVAANAGAGPAQAEAALAALDKDLAAHVVALDGHALLVSLALNDIGEVFIVKDGAVAWRIGEAQAFRPPTLWPLRAWKYPAPEAGCAMAMDDDWAECNFVSPSELGPLPPAASGARRFWVNAVYAQRAGDTQPGQVSFWSWDGARATPLQVGVYFFALDIGAPPSVSGDVLSLAVKEDFRSMLACGACAGRQRLWRFAATPSAVRDLGKTSLVPELDLIDAIYDRAAHHRSLTGLASPAAARVIAKVVAEGDPHSQWPMGALDGWVLAKYHRQICVATDSGGAVAFWLARSGSRVTVTSARRLQAGLCDSAVSWPGATRGS